MAQRRAVQMVFQDPYSSLNPRLTVRQMLRELLTVHKLVPRADVEGRCRELMSLVGLPTAALDGLAVMYLGRVVEEGTRDELFASVRHPYARALMAAAPRLHQRGLARPDVRGEPPSPIDLPAGCRFHPRCPQAADICRTADPAPRPVRAGSSHIVACHFGADPGPAEIQAR